MAIARKSAVVAIGATETTILLAGAAEDLAVVSMIAGNVDGQNAATLTLHVTKSGGTKTDFLADLPVVAGEAVELFVGGRGSLFLENGDKLSATASAAGDVTVLVSYMVET